MKNSVLDSVYPALMPKGRSIVREVNGSDVISDEMFLSNSVYEYDGESFSIH